MKDLSGKPAHRGSPLVRPCALIFVDDDSPSSPAMRPQRPLVRRYASAIPVLRFLWVLNVLWFELGVYRVALLFCTWPDRRLSEVSRIRPRIAAPKLTTLYSRPRHLHTSS